MRVRFLGGTAQQQEFVKQNAITWTEHANLKFQFGSSPDAEIRVTFDEEDGAWSYVGTDAQGIPVGQATLNLGWLDRAVVLHEFGHAIGLGHEHQNPAGGIQWNEAVVIADLARPPNRWDPATVRHNVLNKYRHDQINGTEFDPKSIMLYSFPPTWTQGGFHSEPNLELSDLDTAFVRGSKMYPKAASLDFVELPVFEPKPIAASIGTPGEEDRFMFKVNSPGAYVVQTQGETDVVMKVFGPDSQTLLVAEDDDSAGGTNARVEADLLAGEYYVQVRHYNRTGGVGAYGISVLRS